MRRAQLCAAQPSRPSFFVFPRCVCVLPSVVQPGGAGQPRGLARFSSIALNKQTTLSDPPRLSALFERYDQGQSLLKACRTCLDDRDVALDVAYLCLFKTRFVDYSARCIFNPHVTRSGSKGGGVLQHVFSCVAKNRSDIAAAVSSLHVPIHSSHQGKLCVQSNHSPRSSKFKLMHHLHARVLACFRGRWPDLKIEVAGFELGLVSA